MTVLGTKTTLAAAIPPLNRSSVGKEDPNAEASLQFLASVIANDLPAVRTALESDKSLSKTKDAKNIPLVIYAAIAGTDMVTLLLEYGADPNARAPINNGVMRDYSVLDVVALLADDHATAALIKAGVNINSKSSGKETAFERMFQLSSELPTNNAQRKKSLTETNQQAVAKLLMIAGADPGNSGGIYGNPFDRMISFADSKWLPLLAEYAPAPGKLVSRGDTLLHLAVKRGDSDAIRLLIERKVDPELKNTEYYTAMQIVALQTAPSPSTISHDPYEPKGYWNLIVAGAKVDPFSLAALGKLAALKDYAKQHPDFVKLKHENGRNLLHWAALSGQAHMIKWLAENGLDPDQADNDANLPLHLALDRNLTETARLLLAVTKLKQSEDKHGRTALTIALQKSNEPIISELLKHALTDQERQAMINREMVYFIGQGASKTVDILLKMGGKADARSADGQIALHVAVKRSLAQTRQLLELGLDVNTKDQQGRTPLHQAIAEANLPLVSPLPNTPANGLFLNEMRLLSQRDTLEIIKLLLSHGADIKAQDANGNTILHLAFQQRNPFSKYSGLAGKATSWLEFLLEQGADPTLQNKQGQTPLQVGMTGERIRWVEEDAMIAILQTLQRYKVSLDQQDNEGMTLLHLAVANDNAKITTALLKQGANINLRNNQGETPLMLKIKNSQGYYTGRELLTLLIKGGADATLLDKDGRSVWQIVCELKFKPSEAFPQMLDAGISPMITNQLGQSALHLGAKHKLDEDTLKRFIKAGANPEAIDLSGRTPFHWSIGNYSHYRGNSFLFKITTNINTIDLEGNTPLHLACVNGNSSLMVDLLTRGTDVSHKNKLGDTPLWLSVGKITSYYIRGTGIFEGKIQRPLHLLPQGIRNDILNSAENGDLWTVKQLLALEPRLISAERDGHNALHAAASAKQMEMVDYLLKAGAIMDSFTATSLGDLKTLKSLATSKPEDFNSTVKLNQLLLVAARSDNPDIVLWLIDQGAKPNESIEESGISALGLALKSECHRTVSALQKNDARPTMFDALSLKSPGMIRAVAKRTPASLSATNNLGGTPLIKAVSDRDQLCVQTLLEAGADPNLEVFNRRSSYTPLQIALMWRDTEIIDMLIEHKLDLNARNSYGFAPLHLATWHGATNLISRLIDSGINVNEPQEMKNNPDAFLKSAGQTPLHLAVIKGDPKMISFLLQKGASLNQTNHLGQKPADVLNEINSSPSFRGANVGIDGGYIRMPMPGVMQPITDPIKLRQIQTLLNIQK